MNIDHLQFLSLFDRHADGCVLLFTFDQSAQMLRKTMTIKKTNPLETFSDHLVIEKIPRLIDRLDFHQLNLSLTKTFQVNTKQICDDVLVSDRSDVSSHSSRIDSQSIFR